ncbi:hypothetical protein [Gordonia shandongensis]|uniref:hypothetical protein n=1 Tax=Gordonia shandongensis TaxID=376351 RepID=UPI000552C2BC|nr:hypothetical protein [Gordonia shandongensis]
MRRSVDIDLFIGAAALFVVAGGLVAAIARPLDLTKGSWLAAYLVLVCGVALAVIGAAQQHTPSAVAPGVRIAQLGGWLVANATVIVGSLVDSPAAVDVGAVLLLVVLLGTAWVGRGLAASRRVAAYAYLAVLVVLAVSAPIGMILARR